MLGFLINRSQSVKSQLVSGGDHRKLIAVCRPLTLLAALVLTAVAPWSIAQTNALKMSESARAYLAGVLDIMEKNALNRDSIDWNRVRTDTFAKAGNARTTADTYVAIAHALGELKEHHSFLMLPDSLDKDQKMWIQVQMRDELIKTRGAITSGPRGRSPFASREMTGHVHQRNGKIFAHVVVPHCAGEYTEWEKDKPYFEEFADKLHGIVADLLAQKPDGWLVDLRGNDGGNMWPMLAGLGPLLGEGDLGSFQVPHGGSGTWFLKDGRIYSRGSNGEAVMSRIPASRVTSADLPWVAVLFDRGTSSSGEAVAISFAGRQRARSFGEQSAGFSTSNSRIPMSDGAALFLCTSVEADRTGRRYPVGLDPDTVLPAPDSRPAEDADAVILAAQDWILLQVTR